MAYKTRLGGAGVSFDEMINQGFGIVTVMNVDVFDALELDDYKNSTAYQIVKQAMDLKRNKSPKYLCTIDTLKVANAPQEGPSKTVTGGQFSNPLIKFGKSARLEMQDALGRAEAIEALGGGIVEKESGQLKVVGLHFGEDFVGPKLLVGDSFFIDQKSGQQVSVKIVFYQFLPDSIFNLTQDAEGDATVFDLNGDLLTTIIKVGNNDGTNYEQHGVFYSIIEKASAVAAYTINAKDLTVTKADGSAITGTVQYSSDDRNTWDTDKPTPVVGNKYWASVVEKGVTVFEDYVIATA